MTKREAKRRCLRAMATTLVNDVVDGAAGWPFEDDDGQPLSEADEERIVAAAEELIEEFERRGYGG